MKKYFTLSALALFVFAFNFKMLSQNSKQVSVTDSLAGFDFKGALEHANEMKTDKEKNFFLNHAKRTYKMQKYGLYPNKKGLDSNKHNYNLTNAKGGNNSIMQGPQPAGCTNVDFEAGNTTGWTVTGDFSIVTAGTDPYGAFPKVYPGGTASLKLNDDNISSSKTGFVSQATRVIPVSAINSNFQLHFAFCILNFPHPSNAAALFQVQFFDPSNNLLSCPQFTCYYANPPGAFFGMPAGTAQTSSVTGMNIGSQVYPVTYVPWTTISMDLSAYIGQNITCKINCNWCIYNYDWGYCYIDADCFPPVANTNTVCPGTICAPPGMSSYTWTSPPNIVSTTSCITAATIGTYTLQYKPFSTCSSSVQTVYYTVMPPPTSGFTSVNSCGNFTFTNTGAGPPAIQTYSFAGTGSPPSYTTTATTSTISLAPGTYTVYHTVANGSCVSTTTLVVVAPAGPNPAFTTPSYTQCLTGNSFVFTAVQAVGTHTYGFNPTAGAPATGLADPYGPVNFTSAGTYTVTHTITNTGCTASASSVIVINPQPVVVANNNGPICTGNNLALSGGGGTTFAWSGPAGFTSALQNPTITAVGVVNSGVYTVTATLLGCTNTATTNVVVTTPTAIANNTGPYCAGTTVQLNAPTASSYTWSGPGAYASNLQNPSQTGATPAMSGVYSVTLNFGGCTATATTAVVVNALPIPLANSNSPICSGTDLNLAGSGGVTYAWTGPAGYISSSQNPTITAVTSANAGVYLLTVIDANTCTNTITTNVIINANPIVTVNNPVVCVNQTIGLNSSGGASYAWTGPMGYSSAVQNPNIPNAVLGMAGQYTVLVTSAVGCTNTGVANIGVNPAPTPSVSTNSPICINNVLSVFGSGGLSYSWTGPNGFFSTAQSPTIMANSTSFGGTYSLTVVDANGCTATTGAVAIVNPIPPINIVSSPNKGCAPLCVTFTAATTPSATVDWIMGDGSYTQANINSSACYHTPGTYTLTASVVDVNGCENTTTYTVEIYPKPIADFNYDPIKPLASVDDVHYTDASYGATITSWNWYFTNTAGATSNIQNPTYVYADAGQYVVALVVKSDKGCIDTTLKSILVGEDFGIWVPNSFTPNSDGLNDIFFAKGYGIVKFELNIFDRWGEKIFTSNDINEAWDGSYQNRKVKLCTEDTYIWIINVTNVFSKSKEFTGHVTLIK